MSVHVGNQCEISRADAHDFPGENAVDAALRPNIVRSAK